LPETSFPPASSADLDKIMKALNDLLEDGAFEASPRNKRFLRFVVEETLAGRGDRIKSYTIAVDVFGRTSDFDGSVDPIVRIEASRLRASLAKYYVNSNRDHEIQFLLPRGGYVPEFKAMASAPADGEGAVAEEDEMSTTTIDGDDSVERAVFASPSQAKVEAQSARPWPGKIRSLWWVLAAGLTAAVVLVGALAASFLMRPPQVVEAPLLLVDQVEPLTNDEPTRILARTLSGSLISALQQFDGLAISPKPTDDRVIAKLLARYPSRSVYLLASELRIDRDTVRLW
jgi:adenylate cyclase